MQVPGVIDGVVFVPENGSRTAALVVAPHLAAAQIVGELAQSMDPAFLPRPVVLLERLPRNELGKLTHTALQEAIR